MRTVMETHRTRMIELLGERLAFERAAGKLYDAVLEKLHPRGGPFESVQARLRFMREEERAHQEWLEEQVRALGGDPERETGGSLVLRGEWRRIAGEIEGDQEPIQLFHALLRAELLDTGGWEVLVELAGSAQDEEAREALTQRLHEEQEHLLFVRHLVSVFAPVAVLDTTTSALESASL